MPQSTLETYNDPLKVPDVWFMKIQTILSKTTLKNVYLFHFVQYSISSTLFSKLFNSPSLMSRCCCYQRTNTTSFPLKVCNSDLCGQRLSMNSCGRRKVANYFRNAKRPCTCWICFLNCCNVTCWFLTVILSTIHSSSALLHMDARCTTHGEGTWRRLVPRRNHCLPSNLT